MDTAQAPSIARTHSHLARFRVANSITVAIADGPAMRDDEDASEERLTTEGALGRGVTPQVKVLRKLELRRTFLQQAIYPFLSLTLLSYLVKRVKFSLEAHSLASVI